MEDGINNIVKSIAEDVSLNLDSARDYLQEEGIDYANFTKKIVSKLEQFIASKKLSEGKLGQDWLQNKFSSFIEKIKGLTQDEIKSRYPSIPQIAFSKLEEKKISGEELEALLKDSSFLSFLENQNLDEQYNQQT